MSFVIIKIIFQKKNIVQKFFKTIIVYKIHFRLCFNRTTCAISFHYKLNSISKSCQREIILKHSGKLMNKMPICFKLFSFFSFFGISITQNFLKKCKILLHGISLSYKNSSLLIFIFSFYQLLTHFLTFSFHKMINGF